MKKNKVFNIISIIMILLCLICITAFSYYIFSLNVIPDRYLFIGYGIYILIILILIIIILSKIKLGFKIVSLILLIIISIGSLFITYNYLMNTYNFVNNVHNNYDTLSYSVLVLKENNYQSINDLNNKNITYLEDDNSTNIKKELDSKITYTEEKVPLYNTLINKLLKNETDAIVLETSYLTLISEEIEDINDKTSVIYTIKLKVKSHQEQPIEEPLYILEEPFILYISGIDQYGNMDTVRGRSDVNQLAVINPKTNHILLVNTPRDYYVQLAGTTGLKDKLTHAGIFGIDKSINTLEDLYGINIDHYLRVNFDTLIKVVDAIKGIDIYSDQAFVPWTNRKLYIEQGWNHMDGAMALAYARERYSYATGDNHRGANQQQVITAIIDKITKSKVLISNYGDILRTLDGSFQTDIDSNTITSFIKYQLDKMPTWNIESIAVTGTGASNYTYSMGTDWLLYVMEPDYSSVEKAVNKINEVLNEN